jgi:hypothetical protein
MELLLFLIVIIIVFWWDSIESFSQDKKDMDFMRALQRFLTKETQYSEYLKFILKYPEYTQFKPVEVFMVLRKLKEVGELSFENIMKFM